MDNNILTLRDSYKKSNVNIKGDIKELYTKFIKNKEQTLIDAAATTVAVNALYLSDVIDYDQITPKMEEAFNLAYPNIGLETIIDRDPSEVLGFLNGWKGKYFEVLVRDELNAGNWIGDVHLDPGQFADIAESVTQPGWDLQIFNDNGSIADAIQLKATNSLSYVQEALERYPDINVLTTSEVFDHSNIITDHIVNSGLSNEDLTNTIHAPMESLFDSDLGEFIEDILPGLPFVIIALTEGRKVMVGKKSFEVAFVNGLERAAKTGLSIGVGALVYALDGGILSLPASFLTRVGFDRVKVTSRVSEKLEKRKSTANQMLLDYSPKLLLE